MGRQGDGMLERRRDRAAGRALVSPADARQSARRHNRPMTVRRMESLDARVRAMASVMPFALWPVPALRRLASASRASTHPGGSLIIGRSRKVDSVIFVVDGAVQATVTASAGRRVTFKVDNKGGVYGMLPMLDGREMPSELIAIDETTILALPYGAIRIELSNAPALWESIALEIGERARRYTDQMKRFIFDEPRLRMAALLLSLADSGGGNPTGPVVIELRLPQERLAEMLGVSRQWTTLLVQQMTREGLIECRYGRVTVLDRPGLRAIAQSGVNAWV